MIKYYCDFCKKEFQCEDLINFRYQITGDVERVADFCKPCLDKIKAIIEGKEKPPPATLKPLKGCTGCVHKKTPNYRASCFACMRSKAYATIDYYESTTPPPRIEVKKTVEPIKKDSDVDRRVCKTCRYECLNKRAAPCCDCSVNGSWEPKPSHLFNIGGMLWPAVATTKKPKLELCGNCKHGDLIENKPPCNSCSRINSDSDKYHWEPKTPPVEKSCRNCVLGDKLCEKCSEFSLWEPVCQ